MLKATKLICWLPARNSKLKSSNITQSAKGRMSEKYLGQDIFSADKFRREVAIKYLKILYLKS